MKKINLIKELKALKIFEFFDINEYKFAKIEMILEVDHHKQKFIRISRQGFDDYELITGLYANSSEYD